VSNDGNDDDRAPPPLPELRTLQSARRARDYAAVAADLCDVLTPETPERQCSLLALFVVAAIRSGDFTEERFMAEALDVYGVMERYPELLGMLRSALRDRTPLPDLPGVLH
jgi:hypothetical protein